MEPSARHVTISGRVQGVAFRWCTQERAQSLGVAGWVRNLIDGRVEAWVEAEPTVLEDMLAYLRRGPSHAHVAECDVRERDPQGFSGFEIRRSP
jgi:acylphosphatase